MNFTLIDLDELASNAASKAAAKPFDVQVKSSVIYRLVFDEAKYSFNKFTYKKSVNDLVIEHDHKTVLRLCGFNSMPDAGLLVPSFIDGIEGLAQSNIFGASLIRSTAVELPLSAAECTPVALNEKIDTTELVQDSSIQVTNVSVPQSSWLNAFQLSEFSTLVKAGLGIGLLALLKPGGSNTNNAPKIVSDAQFFGDEDNAITGAIVATDPEHNALTYEVSALNTLHGNVTINAQGQWTYVPDAQFYGVDEFTVIVSDGSNIVTQTITVTVDAVNDAPNITSANTASGTEDTAVTGIVTATDVENQALTYSATTQAYTTGNIACGTVSIDAATGQWTYNPSSNFNGVASFVVSVSDGGITTSQTITVTVGAVNNAPNITSLNAATGTEDTPVTGTVTATDVENQTLTYSATTQAYTTGNTACGTVSINATTGQWTYNPSNNFNGLASFVVSVSDGNTVTSQTITVSVGAVNDAPTITSSSTSNGTEDTAVTGTVTVNDVDSTSFTYGIAGAASNGTVSIDNAGQWTYTPASNFNGAASFVVSVSDGNTVASQTITVNVGAVNDAPTITSSSTASGTEDTVLTGTVTVNDVESTSFTYGVVGAASSGNVSINATTGQWTYNPSNNFNGVASFVVSVSDGAITTSQTITVTVGAVDDAPSITSSSTANGTEDTAVTGTVTATDVENQALTYSATTQAYTTGNTACGTVSINAITGQWTYNPSNNFNGVASFVVSVSDGAITTSQTITVTVGAVDDAPSITSSSTANGTEDTAVTGTVTATDAENQTLTYSATTQAYTTGNTVCGTVSIDATTGQWTYTPSSNFNGAASFVVSVSDGNTVTSQTITVTVGAVDDAPSITSSGTANGIEDTALTGNVTVSDVDSTIFTYGIAGAASNGTVSIDNAGQWTYTPTSNFNGLASFVVSVSDGNTVTSQTITVTVGAVNDAPTITSSSTASGTEDTAVTGTVTVNDVDSTSFTYGIVGAASNGTVSIDNAGQWTYTPATNFNGAASFVVSVSDGNTVTSQTITVAVGAVNDAPSITSSSTASGTEDTAVTGTVTVNDVDSTSFTYGIVGAASNGTVSIDNAGQWTYTPASNFNGAASFVVSVSDGNTVTSQTITVTVGAVDDAPTITSSTTANGTEDTAVIGTVTVNDVDSISFTYGIVGAASNGTVSIDNAGQWTYTPASNFNGVASFVVRVSDGSITTSQTITVTVGAVNDAPIITSSSTTNGTEDNAVTGTVTAQDVDSTTLSYSIATQVGTGAGNVSIDSSSGQWTYTPASNFNGVASFVVSVSDGSLSTSQTITVTVGAVDDAPTIISSSTANGTEDTVLTGTVTVNDVDSTSFTYGIVGIASNGTVSIDNAGQWTYTPASNFNGAASFVVSVSDGNTVTSQTITVAVGAVDDAPTITSSSTANGTEDTAVTGTVTVNDVDSTSFTYGIVGAASNGTASIDNAGQWTYTPSSNFNGVASFVVSVSDGNTVTSQTITVTVGAVDDVPTITSSSTANVTEDTALTGNVTVSDVDSTSFTYGIAGAASNGNVSINTTTGQWTYTPASNFNGAASFVVSVSDGGITTSQTITVTVGAVDDAPTITSSNTASGTEDTAVTGTVTVNDVDSTSFTYGIVGAASNGTVSIDNAGQWTYTPASNFNGVASFVVSVSDGNTVTSQTITVTVGAVNDAPTITSSSIANGIEDTALTGNVTVSDVDSTSFTYGIVGAASNGTVSIDNAGQWTYTPASNFNGVASFVVSVSDGNTVTSQTITVTVGAVDDAPTITSSSTANGIEDTALTGTVTVNDVDSTSFTYGIVGAASNGTVSIDNAGAWTYTPASNFNGVASFVVSVSDGNTVSSQTITVTVNPVNDAPVFNAGSTVTYYMYEDSTYSYTAPYVTDVEGNALTYALNTTYWDPNLDGVFTIDSATGVWTFTPNANYFGATVIEITVTDALGASSTQLIDLQIQNVDDPSSGSPVIHGLPMNGATLTADISSITDNDIFDINQVSFMYQWQISSDQVTWTNISGATGSSYTLTGADLTYYFQVEVSYMDQGGTTETLYSGSTAVVQGSMIVDGASNNNYAISGPQITGLGVTFGYDGGDGLDKLLINASGYSINLNSLLDGAILSVENYSLALVGPNSLIFTAQSMLATQPNLNQFSTLVDAPTYSQVMIQGTNADTVNLSGSPYTVDTSTQHFYSGQHYYMYQSTNSQLMLFIDTDVNIIL